MSGFEFKSIVEGTDRGMYRKVAFDPGHVWVRQTGDKVTDDPKMSDRIIQGALLELQENNVKIPDVGVLEMHQRGDEMWPQRWTLFRPGDLRPITSRLSLDELCARSWDLTMSHSREGLMPVYMRAQLLAHGAGNPLENCDEFFLWTMFQPDRSRVLIAACCRESMSRYCVMFGLDRRWVRRGWEQKYFALLDDSGEGQVFRIVPSEHPVVESVWKIHSARE